MPKSGAIRQKKATLKYIFKIGVEEIFVCKRFYLATLNISQSLIEKALAKQYDIGVVQSPEHLKRQREPNQKAED